MHRGQLELCVFVRWHRSKDNIIPEDAITSKFDPGSWLVASVQSSCGLLECALSSPCVRYTAYSGWLTVRLLTTYLAEISVYYLSDAWDMWKSFWLRFLELTSFHKSPIRLCLWDECLPDILRFLPVFAGVGWTQVFLVQRHRVRYQELQLSCRFRRHFDFI